ncbi:hypothetical protein ACWY4P_24920 [Streptomyces sp. LZ34]
MSSTCDSGYSPASHIRSRAIVSAGDPALGSARANHSRAAFLPCMVDPLSMAPAISPSVVSGSLRRFTSSYRLGRLFTADSTATSALSRGPARSRSAIVRATVVTLSPPTVVISSAPSRSRCSVPPWTSVLAPGGPVNSTPCVRVSMSCNTAAAVWLTTSRGCASWFAHSNAIGPTTRPGSTHTPGRTCVHPSLLNRRFNRPRLQPPDSA